MNNSPIILLDFETTGLDPDTHEIIEIGLIIANFSSQGLTVEREWSTLIKPENPIPMEIEELTGISNEMVEDSPSWDQVSEEFRSILASHPIIAHNAKMEGGFLTSHFDGEVFEVHDSIHCLALALPDRPALGMESLRAWAGFENENSHRALEDTRDLYKLLNYVHGLVQKDRPWLHTAIQAVMKEWWWLPFFEGPNQDAPLPDPGPEGDLRELKKKDEKFEADWSEPVQEQDVQNVLRQRMVEEGLEFRDHQERMALKVSQALNQGNKVALEAPTGTGKSLAYLLPGVLSAQRSGAPLVVSTHSKTLQDQLQQKDLPLLGNLLNTEVKATVVKGQENYLCLRKLHEAVDDLLSQEPDTVTDEERLCMGYLLSLKAVEQRVEIDRIPRYLKFMPAMGKLIEQVRSQHLTTIGPGCPYYKQCHFFKGARLAHESDVIISNHALTFRWPNHLPQIRNVVFDEAHHLVDQLTETQTLATTSRDVEGLLKRLTRKKRSDTKPMAQILLALDLPDKFSKKKPADFIKERAEDMEERTLAVAKLAQAAFKSKSSWDIERVLPQPSGPMHTALKNLRGSVQDWLEYLGAVSEALKEEGSLRKGVNLGMDLLLLHLDRWGMVYRTLEAATDFENQNHLRTFIWSPNYEAWKIHVAPIEVSDQGDLFFEGKRGVVLTSATLASGQKRNFVVDRMGLKLDQDLEQLPSPFPLEDQARVFIPKEPFVPGTPAHLEALIDFTEKMAQELGGKTLLLMTANSRLRVAARELRERLTGFEVFDSLSDPRAVERFKEAEKAVLIGSERYGEGLDIPGPALSCVILEKINESMTRGALAEARKARSDFAIYDFDFPLRMIWLKQRVGRLIRSRSDCGFVVVFDPRYHKWSASSQGIVNRTLAPIPVMGGTCDQILETVSREWPAMCPKEYQADLLSSGAEQRP